MDTITQPRMSSAVGASPAKKQKTRSYAAVVRSSFKPEPSEQGITQTPSNQPVTQMTSQDQRVSSNGTKCKSQTLDPRRSQSHLDENQNCSSHAEEDLMPLPSELDVQSFLRKLDQALELEVKFRGAMQPSAAGVQGKPEGCPSQIAGVNAITSGMRDGSAHVLRCLKVWYDLPSDVLFNAISSIDRFLAKMKAQPKHLSCIAVSAFHLACCQHRQLQSESGLSSDSLVGIPDPADLVSISQSRCSPSDLLRMQNILRSKLEINPLQSSAEQAPVTSLTFLKLMYQVVRATALRLDLFDLLPHGHGHASLPDHLVHQLEILACDSMTLNYRPCEVALALLATDIQSRVDKDPKHTPALRFLSELQKYCNISSEVFVDCLNVVMSQLDKYNGECMVAHRQRLVWKLSNRTLRHLRPTDKLRATLPTICEAANNQAPSKRARSTSECSLRSEEDSMSLSSEDYEDCDLNRSTSSSDSADSARYYADTAVETGLVETEKLCVIEEPMDVEVETSDVNADTPSIVERRNWDTEE